MNTKKTICPGCKQLPLRRDDGLCWRCYKKQADARTDEEIVRYTARLLSSEAQDMRVAAFSKRCREIQTAMG